MPNETNQNDSTNGEGNASSVPYIPPTEEELQDLLHGPRGRSILEIIEELECQGDE
jgi:hypothetical protein